MIGKGRRILAAEPMPSCLDAFGSRFIAEIYSCATRDSEVLTEALSAEGRALEPASNNGHRQLTLHAEVRAAE